MQEQYSVDRHSFRIALAAFVVFVFSSGWLPGQVTGQFVTIGSMNERRIGHSATRLADGRVLVAGGSDFVNGFLDSVKSAELYDPATRTFTRTGNMLAVRSMHSAILLDDGRVLIAGGFSGPTVVHDPVLTTEIFNPADGTFSPGPQLTSPHIPTIVKLKNSKVLITDDRDVDLFDPASGALDKIGSLSSPPISATLLPTGNVLFIPGGLNTSEVFDSTTKISSAANLIDLQTESPLAHVLKNGKVLIEGDLWKLKPSAQVYDPHTYRSVQTGDLAKGRYYHSAALLSDGTVLIVGGQGVPASESAEIFDPATNSFRLTSQLSIPGPAPTQSSITVSRSLLSATPLQDGTVLVTGGARINGPDVYPYNYTPLSIAELYIPNITKPRCTPDIVLSNNSVDRAGSSVPMEVQIEPDCAWSLSGLPNWITASGTTNGTGFAQTTLAIAANTGNARSSTFYVNESPVFVAQQGSCVVSLSPGGQVFGIEGSSGIINVSAGTGCPWAAQSNSTFVTITGPSASSGNGSVNFQVAPNLGATRSGLITIAGKTFTVEQLGAFANNLPSVGSIPHFAAGGDWKTTTTLINTGSADATVRINYLDNSGQPTITPSFFPQTGNGSGPTLGSTIERVIPGGGLLVIEASDSNSTVREGWIRVDSNGALAGFSTYGSRVGTLEHEASTPLESQTGSSYLMTFDNTTGSGMGIAITNSSGQTGQIIVSIRDETGVQIFTSTLDLNAGTHQSFVLSSRYPVSAGKRGTVQFTARFGVRIGVVGLRFTSLGALSGVPVIAR